MSSVKLKTAEPVANMFSGTFTYDRWLPVSEVRLQIKEQEVQTEKVRELRQITF